MTLKQNEFTQNLLHWFQNHKRWMPWRETKDPYYIWISEIMLQQTKVETVIPYFENFIKKFPSIEKLSEASEEEVLKSWEGLGYYSRGRNILKSAQWLVKNHEGKVPKDIKVLLKLPGIGPYTAGAILSIAYNQPVPAVDGNVLRIFSRIGEIYNNIENKETVDEINQLVLQRMPFNYCGSFNEALMELGAVLCTPKSPKCFQCPVTAHCKAYINKTVEQLPIRMKKNTIKKYKKGILWIEKENQILIRKNPSKGMLAGLWSFPVIDIESEMIDFVKLEKKILKQMKWKTKVEKYMGEEKHVFTHQKWDMHILQCSFLQEVDEVDSYCWKEKNKLKELAFPTVYTKIIDKFIGGYRSYER
jgi:A/G-specific adenine glycosylase